MTPDTHTAVSDDGLRFEAKLNGSPFFGSGNMRSCFKCGKHRLPSALRTFKFMGRQERVCAPACEPR
ncbi:hypothetical protein [Inhella crocodyli]|jgi:hypothetical protein|uniref:Uncharacterized protein n=1 Tax=Inhella crocodyli TaxID=2499851 RepID=A0A3S2UCY8_9BURK|nr:hypothetical protein [Inhella crocodyli]RVT84703.1 hypothetical protein EOD73_11245 [Inhella crocodyli]